MEQGPGHAVSEAAAGLRGASRGACGPGVGGAASPRPSRGPHGGRADCGGWCQVSTQDWVGQGHVWYGGCPGLGSTGLPGSAADSRVVSGKVALCPSSGSPGGHGQRGLLGAPPDSGRCHACHLSWLCASKATVYLLLVGYLHRAARAPGLPVLDLGCPPVRTPQAAAPGSVLAAGPQDGTPQRL